MLNKTERGLFSVSDLDPGRNKGLLIKSTRKLELLPLWIRFQRSARWITCGNISMRLRMPCVQEVVERVSGRIGREDPARWNCENSENYRNPGVRPKTAY